MRDKNFISFLGTWKCVESLLRSPQRNEPNKENVPDLLFPPASCPIILSPAPNKGRDSPSHPSYRALLLFLSGLGSACTDSGLQLSHVSFALHAHNLWNIFWFISDTEHTVRSAVTFHSFFPLVPLVSNKCI